MRHCHVVEPTNNETLKQDIASNQHKTKASESLKALPILALCGGAAIKALYTNNSDGGRNHR